MYATSFHFFDTKHCHHSMSSLLPSLRLAVASRASGTASLRASFSSSALRLSGSPNDSERTSPGKTPVKGERPHPGYVAYETPATSADPKDMEAHQGKPAGEHPMATTKASTPHPEIHNMAKGAETERGGSDAITPPERSQKNWGPNSRTPEFNEHEGKRRPVIDGGSHEGGLREDGKGSKT